MKTQTIKIVLIISLLITKNLLAMEKKNVEKVNVIKYTMESSLATLINDVGEHANKLYEKALELGLEISGPQIWQYSGSDGKPETTFTLDMCIPVKEAKGDPGQFSFAELPPFQCVSDTHNGPWNKLSNAYERIMGELSRKGMIPTGISREVYIHCDMENEENCVTEVQIQVF
jgi:effector-binding domain-containing protein